MFKFNKKSNNNLIFKNTSSITYDNKEKDKIIKEILNSDNNIKNKSEVIISKLKVIISKLKVIIEKIKNVINIK